MKANSKDIEWLLDNITQYQISKETGLPQSKLSELKNGKIKIGNLSLRVASELTAFSKKVQKERGK